MKKILMLTCLAATAGATIAQSLLTTPPETPEQTAARESIVAMQHIRSSNLGMLRDVVGRAFPVGVDKQAVVTLWGSHASRIFALLDAHVAYCGCVMSADGDTEGLAELAAIVAPVPPAEYRDVHEDGTVTLLPQPTPTPEP